MGTLVQYRLNGSIASVTMDDGKVNALSPAMIDEIRGALDRAAGDGAVVVLGGREGVFSAGFDLRVLRAGGADAATMIRTGFDLAARVLTHPRPVVVACTGHAVAMGAFLLLSGDYLVGADGPYRLVANEVAIGLPVPVAAVEILRHRLAPAAFRRSAVLAEPFSPRTAVGAGFLDRVVEAAALPGTAMEVAERLLALDADALAATKLQINRPVADAIRAAADADAAALLARA